MDIISSCMAGRSGPPRKGIDITPTEGPVRANFLFGQTFDLENFCLGLISFG